MKQKLRFGKITTIVIAHFIGLVWGAIKREMILLRRLCRFLCAGFAVFFMLTANAMADCATTEIDVLGDGTQCETVKFSVTTTSTTSSFLFRMSAAGMFYVDWGDGVVEQIDRTDNTEIADYSHSYETAGSYIIRFAGESTAYNTGATSVMTFYKSSGGTQANVYKISGSLGALFPTLGDGSQPRFNQTFRECSELIKPLPSNLFTGITGAPVSYMFSNTFRETSKLTGAAPRLGNLVGPPAPYMFYYTFYSSHVSSFPSDMFAGINGAPADYMYSYTFGNCRWLSSNTKIPSAFFGTFDGPPATGMFYGTFINTFNNLTGAIPENLFAGIVGPAAPSMFKNMFADANGITSIPANLFAGISGPPAKEMFYQTFYGTKITSIPANLFSGISGPPASGMFYRTFYYAKQLKSIPETLFSGIQGPAASTMFEQTFYGCSGLTGFVPPHLFDGITGTANRMMSNIFYNSGLVTTCPTGYTQYITGYEGSWSSKVACYKCDEDYELAYANGCHTKCNVLDRLHVGDVSYPLFADKTDIKTPILHILKDNEICYAYMESGNTSGLNFKIPNGTVYHVVDPTTPKYNCVIAGGLWDADTETCSQQE